jgi:hypothetical protein
VILDHLEMAGLSKVARFMKEEISKILQPEVKKHSGIQSAKGPKKDVTPQQLLLMIQQSFDKGNKVEFFRAFDQLLPADLRKKDFSYKKLEFYL